MCEIDYQNRGYEFTVGAIVQQGGAAECREEAAQGLHRVPPSTSPSQALQLSSMLCIFVWIHHPAHGDVRGKHLLLEAIKSELPFYNGVQTRNILGFREIFNVLQGSQFSLAHLDLEIDKETEKFQLQTELLPVGLVGVQAIRSLQFYVCYYIWVDFRKRSNSCLDSSTYEFSYIVVAVIPFWLRFLQCVCRVIEERNALVMRSLYDISRRNGSPATHWRNLTAATSGITTIYNTYWDIVVDWGLLQKNSKNRWLRDKLLIPYKAVYPVAIVVNLLLRLVWMQLVLDFNLPFLHINAMVAVACMESETSSGWRMST